MFLLHQPNNSKDDNGHNDIDHWDYSDHPNNPLPRPLPITALPAVTICTSSNYDKQPTAGPLPGNNTPINSGYN